MCGIFGLWHKNGPPLDPRLVWRATTTLRHRGPDDEGYLLVDTQAGGALPCAGPDTAAGLGLTPLLVQEDRCFDLALGFRRLSILDLSPAGHQPMASADGRYWLVFNGEIYNYIELRQELSHCGHTFRSNADSEVLLAAYIEWGAQALTRLVGMFALAIWDCQARQLFLARDFFGIKPLYYCWTVAGFAFASEIKALLNLPGVRRQANPQQIYDYLRYRLTDHNGDTFFSQIRHLPAAHYLEITLDQPEPVQPVRYWQIEPDPNLNLSQSQAQSQLRALFLENIKLHLRSDVPLGAALSGGIDSSAIVTAMRHLQGEALPLYTFSYLAGDPQLNEAQWIDLISRRTRAESRTVQPDFTGLITDLARLVTVQDEPFISTSIYAQNRVFWLAQQAGIKVMLDGQGADEILAGYPPHLAARLASLLCQLRWLEAARFLKRAGPRFSTQGSLPLLAEATKLLLPPAGQRIGRRLAGKATMPPWLNAPWFAAQGVVEQFQWRYGREVLREQLQRSVVELSLPMLLRYEDRNSMAYSIESRVPFLTPKLVNFIFSLPESFIISPEGSGKAIFRQAMAGLVPAEILERRDKIGFETPQSAWLAGLRPWVEGRLNGERARAIPALKPAAITAEWPGLGQNGLPLPAHLWRVLNLIQWAEQYQVEFDHHAK